MMRRRHTRPLTRSLLAGWVVFLLAVSTATADQSHVDQPHVGPSHVDQSDDARSTRGAQADELTITAQEFAIDADSVLTLTIELPAGFDTASLGAEGSNDALVIDVHQKAATLAAVRDVLDGERTPVRDSLSISLALADADPRVTRPSPTELTVAVQTETVTSTADAMRLPDWGVYPLTIELTDDGDAVADVSTFVARRAVAGSRDDVRNDLAVGIVLGTTVDPTIRPDGSARPSSGELAELERLADALEAADAAATDSGEDPLLRTVRVQPATLAVLGDVEPELAARLVRLLGNGDVVAQPRLPFDPSSAIAVGRDDLYTRLLRDGEDALSDALPGTRVDRTLLVATDPISVAAVSLRRDLGTQMVVLPFDRYLALDGNIGTFTDTSQLLDLATTGRGEMPAMLIDPVIAQLLEREGDDAPLATAVALVAQLVALAGQIGDSGGSAARHGIVLARRDGGVIDPELLGALSRLLIGADGVRVVDPSDLASVVDTQVIAGRDLRVTPRAEAGVDLRDRFTAIDDISRDVLGTASMLPASEPLVTAWTEILSAVVSTALDEDAAAAMIDTLRDQVDVYRNGVRGPDPYTFRFTGRSGSIKFKLSNLTDRPLVVRITMSSAKLEFRDPDLPVELPPLQETEVTMPFEALSNGTSSVFLRIFTPAPEPSPATQIVDDIILTARITTLTGLGQLVTGAALLVLCTWWIRHWRQSRRRRLTEAVAPRHPAASPARQPALAPDAAASRVPPS